MPAFPNPSSSALTVSTKPSLTLSPSPYVVLHSYACWNPSPMALTVLYKCCVCTLEGRALSYMFHLRLSKVL